VVFEARKGGTEGIWNLKQTREASMMVLCSPEIWRSSVYSPLKTVVWFGAPYWNFKFISSSLPALEAAPTKSIDIRSWVLAGLAKLTQPLFAHPSSNVTECQKLQNLTSIYDLKRPSVAIVLKRSNTSEI